MPPPSLEQIAAEGNSVLFPDTCFILDIVRTPTRNTTTREALGAASRIRDALTAGQMGCVISRQVELELGAHRQGILVETQEHLARLRETLARVEEWTFALGGAIATDTSHLDPFPNLADGIIQSILDHSPIHDVTPEISHKGYARMMANRAPAKPGKESTKDCVVVESYLEAALELRNSGHGAPIVFASSNTKDFLSGGQLHPEIEAEFAPLGVVYARSLEECAYRLGINQAIVAP